MSLRRRFALPTIAACLAAAALASFKLDGPTIGDGWLFDVALAARAQLWPATVPETETKVVVVAIDQRSLDSDDLAALPRVLFSPIWAELVTALGAAGARVVAFDLLFAYDANKLSRGYDLPFLKALSRHRDRIVLGRSANTLPVRTFRAALRSQANALGRLEIPPDSDEVVRRVRLHFDNPDGTKDKSIAGAVLGRAGTEVAAAELMPAPRRQLESMPTYALVDVLRCATQAPERLREVFGGRLVFIGSVLPVEDRAVPSSRYLSRTVPPADDPKAACALPRLASAAPKSRSVPGVYVHASAADAALTGEHLRPVPVWFRIGLAGLAGGLGAVVGMVLAPWTAVVLALLSILALWAGEVVLIESRLWLPAALPMLAVAVSTGLGYLVHYLVEERRRLSIQRAFGRYLAPSLVESLADDPNALHLGGTVRPVTVMFADLSGFTALSTKVGPEELVALTNQYLALVSDEVDDSGGYVDKYIGDAVMAIWGAPVADPEHARHAVDAGFKALQRIQEAARQAAARGEHGFGIKIGVYSGEAIVGNVGSEKRYNYTAVGETVNVAARMESLPGVYGCSFLIGPTTAAAVDDEMLLREIDWVAVKGRAEPLTIFEPLARSDAAGEAERATAARYAEALALYRQRRFAEAADRWQAAGPEDGPAQVMAARAHEFAENPPDADWDGVNVMEGK